MKKNYELWVLLHPTLKKLIMEIKIAIVIVLASAANVFGTITYSQSTKVTLDLKDTTIEQVLDEIEDQSEFYFIFNQRQIDVDRVVNIHVENKLINEILPDLFTGTNVNYTVLDRKILLSTDPLENSLLTTALINDQQQIIVSGTVSDAATGGGMPGVNIQVKGTTIGTISDIAGKYSLPVPDRNAALIFSFIGYVTQEIPLNGRTTIEIALKGEVTGLEEVVVVGYGTAKKVNLTGSLAIVDADVLKSINTPNMVSGLAGKLPGLRVLQRTSEPGAYNTIYDIRGFGTPLIVVDGMVRTDFNRFDPNEIESMTVLKDATAAVYGVQAANGVILVTTKKGAIGKPVITYNASYEFQKITNNQGQQDVGSSYDFAVLTTEMQIYQGTDPGSTTYSPEDLQKFQDGTYPPGTDWLGLIYRDYANVMRHNLNISGGTERIKYFTSVGYVDELGLFKTGDLNYQRYNVRSSVTGKITDRLSIQLNVDGIYENKNGTSYTADQTHHYTRMNKPIYSVFANNNPQYLQDVEYPYHPLACIDKDISGYTKDNYKTFQANLSFDYNFPFIDGLSAKFMYGFYTNETFQKLWRKTFSVYTYDAVNDLYKVTGVQNKPSNLTGTYSPLQRNQLLGQLTFERIFIQKHNVKGSLVFESRHEITDNLWARKEFAIDVDQFFAGVAANAQVTSSNIYENANQNVIGRLNYDYSGKYLFEFGFNYGGSSKFPKGKRWGFFPYMSAGWRLSEESFIKNNLSYITNLKLRGSFGQTGDDGASTYQFMTGYNYPSGNYIFDNVLVPGIGFRGMPNPNISWFTVNTKNFGIDLSLFKGLISLQFDIFRRDRSGLLATRSLTIPASVGAALPQENLNKDMTKGYEVVIGHTNILGKFSYGISANVTYTRGQFTQVERVADGNSYLNWRNNTEDRWTNMTWGYNYIGQFQSVEEILAAPLQDAQGNRTLKPGDLKYEDVNKDGMLSSLDMVPISRSDNPGMYYGLDLNMSWRKFDMVMFFQGASQFNRTYGGYLATPLRWGRNSIKAFNDRWHHEDIYDVNSPWVPGYYPPTGSVALVPSTNWVSTFWRPDASYLRFKNLEFGYTLENTAFNRLIKIPNIRVYVSGFNIYTFTKLKYLDPEMRSSTGEGYPITRDTNFGLTITF